MEEVATITASQLLKIVRYGQRRGFIKGVVFTLLVGAYFDAKDKHFRLK